MRTVSIILSDGDAIRLREITEHEQRQSLLMSDEPASEEAVLYALVSRVIRERFEKLFSA
jgi:dTDP-glucose pyrophosphorylase